MLVTEPVCLRAQFEERCAGRVELIGPGEDNGLEPVGAHSEPAGAADRSVPGVGSLQCERTPHRGGETTSAPEQLDESEIREALGKDRCILYLLG